MRKTWTEKLNDSHGFPCVEVVKKTMMGIRAGQKMVIAPPLEYQELMKKIPKGKVVTVPVIREALAKKHNADVTCPLTAGIFINIVANAADEMKTDVPWWRTVKTNGELNEKYPGGKELQASLLEAEGIEIDKSNKKWFVKNPDKVSYNFS